jgi:hypothetical protein
MPRNPLLVLGFALLLILSSIFGAQRLSFASGIDTLVSPDSPVYKDFMRYSRTFGSEPIVLLLSGESLETLVQPENLQAMEQVSSRFQNHPDVLSILSLTSLLKETLPPTPDSAPFPPPQELLNLLRDPASGELHPRFQPVLPDPRHALVLITLKGDLSLEEQHQTTEELEAGLREIPFKDVEVLLTGSPVVSAEINKLIQSNLRNTLILSLFLMLLVLALLFRVQGVFLWRWLTLSGVVLAIIYLFGFMGWLNIPLTMSTMSIFPILVGLGIDYGIQLHNRYDEETRKGEPREEAGKAAVLRIGPAIGVALVASLLGISVLLLSPLPLITGFAQSLMLGLGIAYIVALFLIPTLLRWRRSSGGQKIPEARHSGGGLEQALGKLARGVIRFPALLVPLALLLSIAGLVVDSRIGSETDETKYVSPDLPPIQGIRRLQEVTGGVTSLNILMEGEVSRPEVLRWMLEMEQQVKSLRPEAVTGASSFADLVVQQAGEIRPDAASIRQIVQTLPSSVTRNLVSSDLSAANMVVSLRQISIAEQKALEREIKERIATPPPGVEASLTGMSVIGAHIFDALTQGRRTMTLRSVILVFAGLLVLFRWRVLRAMVATLPMALVIGWSALFMYLTGMKFTPLTATIGALILGIGTEFTILLLWRYHEERGKGEEPAPAMVEAVSRLGKAILASGVTTMAGFGALYLARDFPILQDFSLVTVADLALALLSALVVLPPLVVWLDSLRLKLPGR